MSRISVIITSYNQKSLLVKAIGSVIDQTLMPSEIILCDDASTDESQALIRDFETRYPKLVKSILHEKNIGVSANRNSGLRIAQGDYVTWLDGDDRFRREKLETERKRLIDSKNAKWAYSQVTTVNQTDNRDLGLRYRNAREGYIFESVIAMLSRAPVFPVVDSSAIKEIGFFDEDINLYEDFELALRLSYRFPCVYCPETLIEYHQQATGLHQTTTSRVIEHFDRIHRKFMNLVADRPVNERTRFERHYLYSTNNHLLQRSIAERRRADAVGHLIRNLRYRPASIFNPRTLYCPVRIILGSGLVNFIKARKTLP